MMHISQLLPVLAAICLVPAAIRARPHLRVNRGLRRAFAGLFVSAVAGIALTQVKSALEVWPLALLMLAGVAFLVWSMHVEQKREDSRNYPA